MNEGRAARSGYTLIGPDGRPYRSPVPGTLGGYRRGRLYGRLDCPSARRAIAAGHYVRHRVFFADEATALAAGYRPCAVCLPDRYQQWRAALADSRRGCNRTDPVGVHLCTPFSPRPEEHPMTTSVRTHETPHGRLTLAASDRGLTRVTFRTVRTAVPAGNASPAARAWLDLARHELDAYFAGDLRTFSVPVDLHRVEDPHRRILDALADVGYGQTTTYGALATRLGLVDDGACQVGAAMARNPVLIVVPCHRVLGAGGALTGYAGGVAVKHALLDLESRDRPRQLEIAV